MADAKTMRGSSLFIAVGNGASPEVFAHPCSLNTTRGIRFSAETSDANVPDCDAPEAISWIIREKRTLSAEISGEGTLHTPNAKSLFYDWWVGENTKNIRVIMNGVTNANGGGYWAGAFHCTNFEVNGTKGETTQCSVTLVSSGSMSWTAAS